MYRKIADIFQNRQAIVACFVLCFSYRGMVHKGRTIVTCIPLTCVVLLWKE